MAKDRTDACTIAMHNSYKYDATLHKPSSLYKFCFFHGLLISCVCCLLSMSGISLVTNSSIQLVGHTVKVNFGVIKSNPSGMLFFRVTFRTCMIQCHNVYRLSSLSMADKSTGAFLLFKVKRQGVSGLKQKWAKHSTSLKNVKYEC